jgi:hypothetical protein
MSLCKQGSVMIYLVQNRNCPALHDNVFHIDFQRICKTVMGFMKMSIYDLTKTTLYYALICFKI